MRIDYDKIDEEMRPIIKVLNSKGYTTLGCCQGHWDKEREKYRGTYIYFKEQIPLFEIESCRTSKKYPSQTKEAVHYLRHMKLCHCFDHNKNQNRTRAEKDLEHKQIINDILEWANNLPNYIEN